MGFREQMGQMRREYRQEAQRLDTKIEDLCVRVDNGLGAVQGNFQRVDLALQATRDQLSATNLTVNQVRADLRETNHNLQGRVRLMEDRFGKMLDLVETTVGEAPTRIDYEDLAERVEALEQGKDNPAA